MSLCELIRGSPEDLLRGSRMPDDPKLMKRCPDHLRKCLHMWLKTGSCLCCVVHLRLYCFGLPDSHGLAQAYKKCVH